MLQHARRAHLLLLAVLLAGCSTARAASSPAPTTVVVVRHAERASETDRDPALSAAGEARARALADALAHSGVSAIYATQFQRTRLTAAPLAERLGLAVRVDTVANAEEHAASLARDVRARHAGETVLVVGHSNTVPLIVRALSGVDVGTIASHQYDDLFVVLLPAQGAARTIRAQYGPRH